MAAGRLEPVPLMTDYAIVRGAKFFGMPIPVFVELIEHEPRWLTWANSLEGIEQRVQAHHDRVARSRQR